MTVRAKVNALKVKVTYKDLGLEKILKDIAGANAKSVNVGVVGPKADEPAGRSGDLTNGENAIIQMYGSRKAHVPGRPFLTEPFEQNKPEVVRGFARVTGEILKGVPVDLALDNFGRRMSNLVQEDMLKPGGIGAPNAPATIAKKGFDHPLIDTAGLVEAISHRIIRKEFGDALEAGAAVGDYEAFVVGMGEDSSGGEG